MDKVSGKGLSTNDYTAAAKSKLDATNVAYGTCSTEAATAAKIITISGNTNWTLAAGSLIVIKFSYTNTAESPTFNVNSTGAKSVLYGTAAITTSNLSYAGYKGRYGIYAYDGTRYVFVGWSYDANSTYSNASLGQGYGTCSTAAATTAKVVTLSSYSLTKGGVVSVKFTYAVPAGATMNINSKGAKAIYYRGAAVTAGIIEAGDVATFIYDGTQYHLLTVDRHRFFSLLVPYGTAVPSEADLNTATYMKVGNYYCSSNATAKTLANCPTTNAFMLTVYSPLSTTIDNETTKTWIYRLRKLQVYTGDEFVQYCYVGDTAGSWTYGAWKKSIKSDNTATTSAAGLMSAADKEKLDGIAAGATANAGDITGVTAGNGLTGGGTSGAVTLAVGAGAGLTVSADAIGHTNSVTAATASEGGSARTLAFGGSFNVPSVTYDAQGHITGKGSIALKLPANPNTDTGATSVAVTGDGNAVTSASYDSSTRKLTLTKGATYNNYSLPAATSSALGGVKTGSNITNSSGTISLTKANVTAALGYTPPEQDTTYGAATTSANGLMTSAMVTKLSGIAEGANKYTLPTASSSTLGGVKTTSTVTSTSGLTACPIISGVPYYKDTNTNTNYYHSPAYSSGVKIGTGSGVADLYVPSASGSQSGVTIVYPAAQCSTFTSDSGTVTPAAVKKAVGLFALANTGGTVSGDVVFQNDASTQAGQPNLTWKTVGSNTPYTGFAQDQADGTFLIASLKGVNYNTGLAIGGGSGNLLWKGVKVATADDLPDGSSTHTVSLSASGWTQQSDGTYTQTASISGVTASKKAVVDVNMSAATTSTYEALTEAWSLIGRAFTVSGGVTFVCYLGKPTTNLSVNVEVW